MFPLQHKLCPKSLPLRKLCSPGATNDVSLARQPMSDVFQSCLGRLFACVVHSALLVVPPPASPSHDVRLTICRHSQIPEASHGLGFVFATRLPLGWQVFP